MERVRLSENGPGPEDAGSAIFAWSMVLAVGVWALAMCLLISTLDWFKSAQTGEMTPDANYVAAVMMLIATLFIPLSTVRLLRRHPLEWCRRHRVLSLFLCGVGAIVFAIAVGTLLARTDQPGTDTIGVPLFVVVVLGLIAWVVALAILTIRGCRRMFGRRARPALDGAGPSSQPRRVRSVRSPEQQAKIDKRVARPVWFAFQVAVLWGVFMWFTGYQRFDRRTLTVLGVTSLGFGVTLSAWMWWSERRRKVRLSAWRSSLDGERGEVGVAESDVRVRSNRGTEWLAAFCLVFVSIELLGGGLHSVGVRLPPLVSFALLIGLCPVVVRFRRTR
jgi:hypothetical protein